MHTRARNAVGATSRTKALQGPKERRSWKLSYPHASHQTPMHPAKRHHRPICVLPTDNPLERGRKTLFLDALPVEPWGEPPFRVSCSSGEHFSNLGPRLHERGLSHAGLRQRPDPVRMRGVDATTGETKQKSACAENGMKQKMGLTGGEGEANIGEGEQSKTVGPGRKKLYH